MADTPENMPSSDSDAVGTNPLSGNEHAPVAHTSDTTGNTAENTATANSGVPATPVAAGTSEPVKKSSFGRFLVYGFAALGALVVLLVASSIIYVKYFSGKSTKIDQADMIDTIMTRNYGKYSDAQKAWKYVSDSNQTYLVRVVQQAKIEGKDDSESDQLYFVAAGEPTDKANGTAFYGVFAIKVGENPKEGLVEISQATYFSSPELLTPERVHFEAIANNQWAWVIKEQDAADPKTNVVHVTNVMLTPMGNQIVEIARFPGSIDSDPGMDCALANERHADWSAKMELMQAAHGSDDTEDTSKDADVQNTDSADANDTIAPEPMRCNHAKWTYTLKSSGTDIPAPLMIKGGGMINGEKIGDKTWKIIFDTKGKVYTVPDDLSQYMYIDEDGD